VVVAVLITLAVGGVDVGLAFDLCQHLRSLGFVPVAGVLTRSEVRVVHGGHVSFPELVLEYEYDAGGRRFTGTAYRSWPAESEVGPQASEVQRQLPLGTGVTVFHDPADPSAATLHTGFAAGQWWEVWVLLPLNAAVIALWVWVFRGRQFDPARARPTGFGWSVTFPTVGRPAAFLIGLAVPVAIGYGVSIASAPVKPPDWIPTAGLVVSVAVGVALAVAFRPPRLEVDTFARELRLFPPLGRPIIVPFAVACGARVKEEKGTAVVSYHCEVGRAGEATPVRLATFTADADASALAAWVNEQMSAERR